MHKNYTKHKERKEVISLEKKKLRSKDMYYSNVKPKQLKTNYIAITKLKAKEKVKRGVTELKQN